MEHVVSNWLVSSAFALLSAGVHGSDKFSNPTAISLLKWKLGY